MIERKQSIEKQLYPGRVLIIYGPRRIGKTTMLMDYYKKNNTNKTISVVGDDRVLQELFNSLDKNAILNWAKPYNIILIDEAQYIKQIGYAVKIIIDAFKDKQIILTGSSSFEISQKAGEPLTGRQFTFTLLPFMQKEINITDFERKQKLEEFLIYGSYPEIILTNEVNTKKRILNELVNSYLLKDILILDNIKSTQLLLDVLKALAFQIGNEVSFSEIARIVGRDVKTIQRYIDILEKTFIIKRVTAYSNNLRNEISRKSKFYFYDLGIRNTIINQFNSLKDRNDVGSLFENFIFMELYKKSLVDMDYSNFYFWRNKLGKEVDIIIQSNDIIKAFECKWKSDSADFKAFLINYPKSKTIIINQDNYLEFIL